MIAFAPMIRTHANRKPRKKSRLLIVEFDLPVVAHFAASDPLVSFARQLATNNLVARGYLSLRVHAVFRSGPQTFSISSR
jgi:hypothetical protein